MKILKVIPTLAIIAIALSSCSKYEEIRDADYMAQQVYFPSANPSNSPTGFYRVEAVAVPGQIFRYTIDLPTSKFVVPLSVYRSGVNSTGAVEAKIAVNTDTVNKILAIPGRLPIGTELLPADKFSVAPSVVIRDGEGIEKFSLTVDLNFLRANLSKKFAIGLNVTSPQVASSKLGTTVVYIDPAFLVPTAAFTTAVNARVVSFSNTSTNGVFYTWDYGDGTPVSTEKAAPHTYSAAGTYTVTLTTIGALGNLNPAVRTATVTIL